MKTRRAFLLSLAITAAPLCWAQGLPAASAVFMAQLLPSGGLDLQNKFRALVYQAVDTSAAWPAGRPAAAAGRRP